MAEKLCACGNVIRNADPLCLPFVDRCRSCVDAEDEARMRAHLSRPAVSASWGRVPLSGPEYVPHIPRSKGKRVER